VHLSPVFQLFLGFAGLACCVLLWPTRLSGWMLGILLLVIGSIDTFSAAAGPTKTPEPCQCVATTHVTYVEWDCDPPGCGKRHG
jgi:hypothetical protein